MLNLELLEGRKVEKVHFIGIDGISMSGLAEILLYLGYKVTGSDIKTSNKTHKLEKLGAQVYPRHSESNITDQDLVVYSSAIKLDNPEMVKASALGIPFMDRATLLGKIMKNYRYAVAVSGTHGKTTTSSMISELLVSAGMDPTINIGAELGSIGGAARIGNSDYFVAEACEYCGNFLKFFPFIGVILNVEFDHADYFKDISHIKDTFLKFAQLIPSNGYLIANADDPLAMEIMNEVNCNKMTFGIKSSKADLRAENISFDENGRASYNAVVGGRNIHLKLSIPGIHNVYNSLAAAAVGSVLECDAGVIGSALSAFTGATRRFELKGIVDGVKVIDDYAHHPSEIKATLNAAGKTDKNRIWCIFQPHTYTRTKSLLNDFSESFTGADIIVVTDIYAAREKDTGEINAQMLAERMKEKGCNVVYISDFNEIVNYLEAGTKPGDLIITMGAGDINKVGEMFLKSKKRAAG